MPGRAPASAQEHSSMLLEAQRFLQAGSLEQALRKCQQVLALSPGNNIANHLAGKALLMANRPVKALAFLDKALASGEAGADLHYDIASANYKAGNDAKAIRHYQAALELNPGNLGARINLTALLIRNDDIYEARKHALLALQQDPSNINALINLSAIQRETLDFAGAASSYHKILESQPANIDVGRALVRTLDYQPGISRQQAFNTIKHFGGMLAAAFPEDFPARAGGTQGRALRIGYVSSDMCRHSVPFFLLPVLRQHSDDVEVYTYQLNKHDDAITESIARTTTRHRKLSGLSPDEMVGQVRKDDIDVLVDLNGHTHGESAAIFVRRSAPVQVSWLGYPNTTGVATMDFRLTDPVADPLPESAEYHSENLVQMPTSFLAYSPPEVSPEVQVPPASKSGFITFASFNNTHKLNAAVARAWARILNACEGSRLLLKFDGMDRASTRKTVLDLFAEAGLEEERIELAGYAKDLREHLSFYNRVDIALDTFPYNGTTTTCEALWMGVPVVGLCGDRHASRVGASILSCLGLQELLADSSETYEQIAVDLSRNSSCLSGLRQSMRQRMQESPLMDAEAFTRELESRFQEMIGGVYRGCGSP